ncbi:MAG: UrcA family protein [Sphingomicrobium sp.]
MTAIRIIIASALITAAGLKAVPALAETISPSDVAVSFVHTADLDLATDTGRRVLDVRLAHAAREVCGTASDVDLAGKNEARKCRDEVLARAHADRDSLLAAAGRGATLAITAGN